MMNLKGMLLFMPVILGMCVLCTYAQAQAFLQDTTTYPLATVIVEGAKFPTKLADMGKTLAVMDKETLQQGSSKDLAQLLNETGLMVNSAYSNPGAVKGVFVRGAATKYTLMLWDGIPIQDPAGGGFYDLRMMTPRQLERVEVFKGGYSTLYGSEAVAGVINLVSAKPRASTPLQVEGFASGGSYGTFKGGVGIEGHFKEGASWPLGLGYRVDYTRSQSQGLSEAAPRDDPQNEEERFDTDMFFKNAISLELVLSKGGWGLEPFLKYSGFENDYDAGAHADDAEVFSRRKYWMSGVRLQGTFLDKGELRVKYARQLFGNNFNDRRNRPEGFSPFITKSSSHFADLYARYPVASYLDVLVGLDYRVQKRLEELEGEEVSDFSEEDPSARIISPYTVLQLSPSARWKIELSGRLNTHNQYGSHLVYHLNPFYLFPSGVKPYAVYSTAFRAPTLSELYSSSFGNENLEPERARTLELGLQRSPPEGAKVAWQVAVFQRTIRDVIVYRGRFPSGSFKNVDKQEDFGAEASFTVHVNPKFHFMLYFAYVEGKLTKKREDQEDEEDKNLIRRPQHTGRLKVQWTPLSALLVQAQLQAYDERIDTDFRDSRSVRLDPYALVDLYASYSFLKDKLHVFVDAKNIFNKEYVETFGFSTPGVWLTGGFSFRY